MVFKLKQPGSGIQIFNHLLYCSRITIEKKEDNKQQTAWQVDSQAVTDVNATFLLQTTPITPMHHGQMFKESERTPKKYKRGSLPSRGLQSRFGNNIDIGKQALASDNWLWA